MEKIYTTKSYKETQKLGEIFAKEIMRAASAKASAPKAIVFGLNGNLGGGKTTFLQGFAKGLGVKEKILSPTFVIQKRFRLKNKKFKNFYHIDCYRIKNSKDILELGFKDIIKNPENIIAIEWLEKIKKILPASRQGEPKNTILIKFKFIDNNKRSIIFENVSFEKGVGNVLR